MNNLTSQLYGHFQLGGCLYMSTRTIYKTIWPLVHIRQATKKPQEKHTSELFGSGSYTHYYFIGIPIGWKQSLQLCVSMSDTGK